MLNLSNVNVQGCRIGYLNEQHSRLSNDVDFVQSLIYCGVKPADLSRLRKLVSSPTWKRRYAMRIVADGKLHEDTFNALKDLRDRLRLLVATSETIIDGISIARRQQNELRYEAQAAQAWWHGLSPKEQAMGMSVVGTFFDNGPERAYLEATVEERIQLLSVARRGIWWKKLPLEEHEAALQAVRKFVRGNPEKALRLADIWEYMRLSDIAYDGVQAHSRRVAQDATRQTETSSIEKSHELVTTEDQTKSAVA